MCLPFALLARFRLCTLALTLEQLIEIHDVLTLPPHTHKPDNSALSHVAQASLNGHRHIRTP